MLQGGRRFLADVGHNVACDDAITSTGLKHIDLAEGRLFQGAREMRTKFAKEFSVESQTSRRQRKKVEMLFAHLRRILKLDGLIQRPAEHRDTTSNSSRRTAYRGQRPARRRWVLQQTYPDDAIAEAMIKMLAAAAG